MQDTKQFSLLIAKPFLSESDHPFQVIKVRGCERDTLPRLFANYSLANCGFVTMIRIKSAVLVCIVELTCNWNHPISAYEVSAPILYQRAFNSGLIIFVYYT